MIQTYHVEMDDGRRFDLRRTSAADAIQSAIELHLGHCAVRCFLGGVRPAAFAPKDSAAYCIKDGRDLFHDWDETKTRIDFDIPRHAAISASDYEKKDAERRLRRRGARKGNAAPGESEILMFDSGQIENESARAKMKHAQP